jgi:hypothetical protein
MLPSVELVLPSSPLLSSFLFVGATEINRSLSSWRRTPNDEQREGENNEQRYSSSIFFSFFSPLPLSFCLGEEDGRRKFFHLSPACSFKCGYAPHLHSIPIFKFTN